MGCATTIFGMWPGYNDTEFMITHFYIEPENVQFMEKKMHLMICANYDFRRRLGTQEKCVADGQGLSTISIGL